MYYLFICIAVLVVAVTCGCIRLVRKMRKRAIRKRYMYCVAMHNWCRAESGRCWLLARDAQKEGFVSSYEDDMFFISVGMKDGTSFLKSIRSCCLPVKIFKMFTTAY